MAHLRARVVIAAASALVSTTVATRAHAIGEGKSGFPKWEERVVHEWMNRARCDPQVEMQKCGAACGDASCYAPIAPLGYLEALNRSARFHADEMKQQGYFAHDSECGLVANLASIYPATCDGSASCACTGGTKTCPCTSWSSRVQLFGAQPSGEIIAGGSDPDQAFYLWLFENFPTMLSGASCAYAQGPPTNGHRWNILKSTGSVGAGVSDDAVGDFSGAAGDVAKIISGSHYPRTGASVDVWASWNDGAAPKSAAVNVDGTCTAMTRARGSDTNGAWTAKVTGVASGCHRYVFVFTDSSGAEVTYPTSGSLGIGAQGSCADWEMSRPAGCGVAGVDAGAGGGGDGGAGEDASAGAGADASAGGGADAGAGAGENASASGAGGDSGCGCRVGARASEGAGGALAIASLALFMARRRKTSTVRRPCPAPASTSPSHRRASFRNPAS